MTVHSLFVLGKGLRVSRTDASHPRPKSLRFTGKIQVSKRFTDRIHFDLVVLRSLFDQELIRFRINNNFYI